MRGLRGRGSEGRIRGLVGKCEVGWWEKEGREGGAGDSFQRDRGEGMRRGALVSKGTDG